MTEFALAEAEGVYLQREWVMDPPPWIAVKLDERVLQKIYQLKVEALVQVTELEVQAKQIEADMYRQIAETMG